ncbi:YncE family protein [Govanella unica]|uniref:Pyrrolo-quinoline quinone repeat domain-containing protein n=1 Tax=Govanella unica TaxID=2975056 RepID=A0A9X3U062_9PROT|nr:hypothetical protein [Govania unica]MDA5194999.1 hypothetical protein [Govania unica]
MNGLNKLLLACAVFVAGAPALAGEYLVVANRGSRDLSIIRLTDHHLAATLPIHETGKVDDVAAMPDGSLLFANVQLDPDETPNAKPRGEVLAFSSRTGQRAWTQKVDGVPHHMTVSADGKQLFVPLFDRQRIEILDTATGAIIGSLYGRLGMHTTVLSNDGKTLYAGSIFTGQIYAFDIASRKLVRSLSLSNGEFGGIAVRPFAVTADDATIYAQLSGLHGFAVLDVAKNKVKKLVRYGDLPADFEYPDYPYNVDHGLELSPDGKTLVMVSESTRKVYVYSVDPLVLRKTIPVGRVSKWVSFSASGDHAYVSNSGDNDISVISMKSLAEVARIATGGVGGTIMRVLEIPDANITELAKAK